MSIEYTRKNYARKRLEELALCFSCRTKPKNKTCITCNTLKKIKEFPSRGGTQKHLYDSRCKECKQAENKNWRENNPDKVIEYRKKDEWNLKKRCSRRNISENDFLTKLKEQNNLCCICTTSISIENSAIDHNHNTGEFRGILCKTCNRALGLFKDSPRILENALDYLVLNGFYGEE